VKLVSIALAGCGSLLAISIALAQTGGSDKSPAKYDAAIYAELLKAPEKARNRPNPLQNDPEAQAAGALLFERHCSECHGDVAEGTRKGPSLLVPEVQTATPGTLFWVLTNGVVRKKMPVWSKLPEPQRWQLVKYLKSLGGPAETPPSVPKP
jgi:mono/diheme cytochrome c family protein